MVSLFAVLGEIQSNRFNFLAGSQTDKRLDDESDHGGSHDSEEHRQADGFQLLNPECASGNDLGKPVMGCSGVAFSQVWIGLAGCQHAGQESANRATYC